MTVKVLDIDGNIECFESNGYRLGSIKEMHPRILEVRLFAGGKLIVKKARFCKLVYKYILFKTKKVQDRLKKIEEANKQPDEPLVVPPLETPAEQTETETKSEE